MTKALDLSGSCRKLDRALLHLDELGDEMEAFATMSSGNLSLADEEIHPHPLGTRHLFRAGALLVPRPEVGLVVGDYIQNLRAALDHLAWELVKRGTSWPPRNPRSIQFPIYSVGTSADRSKRTFSNQVGKELPGITSTQRATIDGYQPYHRGKWHLAVLSEFSNQDKHRVITPVGLLSGRILKRHLGVTKGSIVAWKVLLPENRRVNPRTPFLEVVVSVPNAEVEMHASLRTLVAFRERKGRYHRIPALVEIGEQVAQIVGTCAMKWGQRNDAIMCASWSPKARLAIGVPPSRR